MDLDNMTNAPRPALFDIMNAISDAVIAAEPALTELDCAPGRGDYGFGMKKSFTAVKAALKGCAAASAADILKKAAIAMMSSESGAPGAIFGTALMKMAAASKGLQSGDLIGIANVLNGGLNWAKMRGEDIRDKTLIDAYELAVSAFREKALECADLRNACAAASAAARTMDSPHPEKCRIGHRAAGSYMIVVICESIENVVLNGRFSMK